MKLTENEEQQIYKKRRAKVAKCIVNIRDLKVKVLSNLLDYEVGDVIIHKEASGKEVEWCVIKTEENEWLNVKYIFVR